MNAAMTDGPGGLGWADVAACNLPTAGRPLRLADFDDLFATSLRPLEERDDLHARLPLSGGTALAKKAQLLAALVARAETVLGGAR